MFIACYVLIPALFVEYDLYRLFMIFVCELFV